MNFKKTIVAVAIIFCILLTSIGCVEVEQKETNTQAKEAQLTEDNQARLIKQTPPPQLTKSLERENLVKRLEFLNDEDRIFYVTLMSHDGKVVAYIPAQGKISSVNSKLTTQEQIVKSPYVDGTSGAAGNYGLVVESPALDGSYGTNGNGIFFFDINGNYIEWNGLYFVSSAPINLDTAPTLTRQVE